MYIVRVHTIGNSSSLLVCHFFNLYQMKDRHWGNMVDLEMICTSYGLKTFKLGFDLDRRKLYMFSGLSYVHPWTMDTSNICLHLERNKYLPKRKFDEIVCSSFRREFRHPVCQVRQPFLNEKHGYNYWSFFLGGGGSQWEERMLASWIEYHLLSFPKRKRRRSLYPVVGKLSLTGSEHWQRKYCSLSVAFCCSSKHFPTEAECLCFTTKCSATGWLASS